MALPCDKPNECRLQEEMRTKIEQLNSIFTSKHCEMEVGTFRGYAYHQVS